jgi:hypothetical protein
MNKRVLFNLQFDLLDATEQLKTKRKVRFLTQVRFVKRPKTAICNTILHPPIKINLIIIRVSTIFLKCKILNNTLSGLSCPCCFLQQNMKANTLKQQQQQQQQQVHGAVSLKN